MQDNKYSVEQIKNIFPECIIKGNLNKIFTNVKNINNANESSIIWIKSSYKNSVQVIEKTKAAFIVCDNKIKIPNNILENKCFIISNNPRLCFAKILKELFVKKVKFTIDKTAIIYPGAKIHKNVFIGPNTYIGKVEIDENTIIFGNTYIYDGVKIGKGCIIHAGTVIGADGFGFEKNENGEWIKFPQIGGVFISDNVEIGSNSSIDRGALQDTFIGRGVKIDDLCLIAHNVEISENTIITGGVKIGGSTKIGKNCWISPNATIINGITIKDNVFVGIGSVVIRNVRANTKIYGNPAKKIGDYLK